jgi:hypothetical protein
MEERPHPDEEFSLYRLAGEEVLKRLQAGAGTEEDVPAWPEDEEDTGT